MKKARIATMAIVFTLAYGGSAYAAGPLEGLVPMVNSEAALATTVGPQPGTDAPVDTTVESVVEPMANNGNELPLEQGVELDTGSEEMMQGDAPVAEEPVPVEQAPAPVTSNVVELTPAKVEKLPKTGDNPYTSSATYLSMIALGVASAAYLLISRRKKGQTQA